MSERTSRQDDFWPSVQPPRVEWDKAAGAIYVRLAKDWPEEGCYTDEFGNLLLDISRRDGSVLGIEMLSEPADVPCHLDVPGQTWIQVGIAWERARRQMKLPTVSRGVFALGTRE